jgi:eukaryotic-like serine/threonine-protein kinase
MATRGKKSSDSKKLRIYCHQCNQKLDATNMKPFTKVPCPTCATQLIIPMWFDSYLLEERCGSGGGAVVYRSLDVTLDREIAIKIFRGIDNSPQFTKIFLHEGRVTASLNHNGIVPIYSCGQFESKCFLIMQYMPNGTLEDQIRYNSPLKISQVLTWILDTTIALQFAIESGVVHHDVKPANILLDFDNNAKISDFGLAYALHDVQSQSLLSELSSYGSPDYVSPEKLENGSEDEKGDIYSLGITLYELLTGKKPFKRSCEEDDILEVREKTKVIVPHELRPEISINLSKLVMRLMNPAPVKRPEYSKIIAELKNFQKKYKRYEDRILYRFIAKHL